MEGMLLVIGSVVFPCVSVGLAFALRKRREFFAMQDTIDELKRWHHSGDS